MLILQFTINPPIANLMDFTISLWYHGNGNVKGGVNIRGLIKLLGSDIGLGIYLRDDALQFFHDHDNVGDAVHWLSGINGKYRRQQVINLDFFTTGGPESLITHDKWTHLAATYSIAEGKNTCTVYIRKYTILTCFTLSKEKLKYYINGKYVSQNENLILTQLSSLDLFVIDYEWNDTVNNDICLCDIDEIEFFSRALSSEEIQKTYNRQVIIVSPL